MISPYVYPILKNTKYPKRQQLFYRNKKSKLTKDKIIEVIAEVYDIDKEFYTIKRRTKNLVDARRILSKLLVFQLGWTKVASAKLMNNDHTSIIHCIKSFDDLYEVDENFKDIADTVFYKLQESI
jgi:chromosomal replication initiation ATPase DnaA